MLRHLAIAFATATLPLGRLASQAAVDSGAFVITLGNDTLSAESYKRFPSYEDCATERVEGAVVRRSPRVTVVRYVAQMRSNGRVCTLEYNTRLADGSKTPNAAEKIHVTFLEESIVTRIHRDSVTAREVALSYAIPEIDGSVYFYETPPRVMVNMDADSLMFHTYPAGGRQGYPAPAVRRAPTRFDLYIEGAPVTLTTDDEGRLLAVDAGRTTFRIRTTRQAWLDIPALARRFADHERVNGPMAISPRNTDSAKVGGANISVAYGSPAARGRVIWGPSGVLGDTLWRTGANASTEFTTNVPLYFSGKALPAGRYRLTTLAIPGRYQLIFNVEGAEVLRVPLTSSTLTPTQERFTISIVPTGERAGLLRLRWDVMELTAPFAVSR